MTDRKVERSEAPDKDHLRMVEAILFAAESPLSADEIASRLPEGADVAAHLQALAESYANRGVNLVQVAGKYAFRTAPDLAFLMRKEVAQLRRLSRAAVETLAIVAYHGPVTRAEIEDIRGVGLSKGTLDVLMEAGWVRPRGRKRAPGRPVMYATTEDFLAHFGLGSLDDLPGLGELRAAGLLETVDEALDRMGGAVEDEDADEDEDEDGEADASDDDAEDDVESFDRTDTPDDEADA